MNKSIMVLYIISIGLVANNVSLYAFDPNPINRGELLKADIDLCHAIFHNNKSNMQKALTDGANILLTVYELNPGHCASEMLLKEEREKYSPLTLALKLHHFDLATQLLEKISNVNGLLGDGYTPLTASTFFSDAEEKSNKTYQESGETFYKNEHVETEASIAFFQLLLKRQVDVNEQDDRKQLPICIAVLQNLAHRTALLLANGACIYSRNGSHQSALTIALFKSNDLHFAKVAHRLVKDHHSRLEQMKNLEQKKED